MHSRDMQVMGICRFSYPAIGGFQVDHETVQERLNYLYADARMQERLRTFECFTLPAMRAQTDQNFTFLIIVGDQMPKKWLSALQYLVRDMPQAVIHAQPPAPHRQAMKEAIFAHLTDTGLPSIQFRMDDDDAVAVTYVERLRTAVQDGLVHLRENRHFAVDFNHGYIARPSAKGIEARNLFFPMWGVALAMVLKPNVPITTMNFAHNKIAHHMPVITLPHKNMFVRGHNEFNDSRQKVGVKPERLKLLNAEEDVQFFNDYKIDADHVRARFA